MKRCFFPLANEIVNLADWARWIAADSDGSVWEYSHRPKPNDRFEHWEEGASCGKTKAKQIVDVRLKPSQAWRKNLFAVGTKRVVINRLTIDVDVPCGPMFIDVPANAQVVFQSQKGNWFAVLPDGTNVCIGRTPVDSERSRFYDISKLTAVHCLIRKEVK